MRMLLTIFCLIFCLSNTAHALDDNQTCRDLKDETSCKGVPGCTWVTYQPATDTQSALYRCQGITAQIKYECHHPSPTNDQNNTIYQQDYRYPYPNDYDLGKLEFSETFQIAFPNENYLKKTETGDEGSYTPINFTCSKPGYKLAGWAEGTYELLFRTQDYTISDTQYSQYTEIIAKDAIKWIWPPIVSNLSFSLSPVWVPAIITCNPGEYVDGKTAQCTKCPAGFYCPGVTNAPFDNTDMGKEQCPDGSTSDKNSTAKTDCYLSTELTQFCIDTEESTTLPTCFMIQAYTSAPYYNTDQQ